MPLLTVDKVPESFAVVPGFFMNFSQQRIAGGEEGAAYLCELFPVFCFHFDMQVTADDVGVFAAGIVPYLNDICAAIGDNGRNFTQLTGLVEHGNFQFGDSAGRKQSPVDDA